MAPLRDRSTWTIYGALAVYGYVLYGLGPALDALREELEVSRTAIGLAGSAFAIGAVATALAAPAALDRIGLGALLSGALAGFGVATVGLVAAPTLGAVIGAALLLGVTGTAILVSVPLVIDERQGDARAAAFAEANMGASAAGIVAPAAIGLAVVAGAGWRAGLAIVIVAIAGLLLAARGIASAPSRPAGAPPPRRLPGAFRRWWLVIVLVVGVEFSIVFWSTDLLRERTGVGRGAASASLALFVAGMAIGRFAGGRLAVGRDPRTLLGASLGVATAGFALLWSTEIAAVSMAGLLVAGLGVALLFPMSLALAMAAAPRTPERASARASLAGALAILVAPFALATLADGVGVHAGFLIVPVLLAGAAVLVVGARDPRSATPPHRRRMRREVRAPPHG